ncbi:FtsX-like permease family protein [Streptomyces sp. NPDC057638]|uniref:FtsX-like permease family protein n=1 Tax=Streptomyces sp. NPDC057638 TaxID=3346190 RepID=UPI003677F2C1
MTTTPPRRSDATAAGAAPTPGGPATTARPRRALAPWVRTRLRVAPGQALALAALVLVTAFLAAAFPRAVHSYESEGLRHAISTAPPARSGVTVTDTEISVADAGGAAQGLGPERMRRGLGQVLAALPAPLRADTRHSSAGVRTVRPVPATDTFLAELPGGRPQFTLSAAADTFRHATVTAGRIPTGARANPHEVEAAVTAETATKLNIAVGARIHLPRVNQPPLVVRVTGQLRPIGPDRPYWNVEPLLRSPSITYNQSTPPEPYWHGALLLPPEAAPLLPTVADEIEPYWRIALDPAPLDVSRLDDTRAAVAAIEAGPALTTLRTTLAPGADAETELDDLLAEYEELNAAVTPVVAVAAFGVGTVAAVVLLMAAQLTAARRHAELTLLRARGGSLRGIAGRLLAETAVPVLPAAVLGCALALTLVPEGRDLPALLAAGAVALIGCAALPVGALLRHRSTALHAERQDATGARPSRRRTVAELTLLVLAVAAVAALRRSGTGEDGSGALAGAAPVLVGVVAALVLVRLYPLPLRLAAHPMARRRGAVGFLALARAGRAPATAALPLLALLVALVTAGFGGSVLAGVADARDRAALHTVGADARIEAESGLPAALADRVRQTPGVRAVVTARREADLNLQDTDTEIVTLVATDPTAYARLTRDTGLGAFPDRTLRRGTGPLPVVVSPKVAARLGDGPRQISYYDGALTVKVAAVRATTPAVPSGEFLIVDGSALTGGRPPTTLLVSGGEVSPAALDKLAPGYADVRVRSAERAAYRSSPVPDGAERMYTAAVLAGAGYAVLALLLSLLRAAPERAALLARLRTMGLTRRQGRGLLVLESLPGALLAAGGGALVGWATIGLLAPGLDLTRLALGDQDGLPVTLRADPASLLVPALTVLAVAAGVATAQAWLSTRRRATTELRAGDAR